MQRRNFVSSDSDNASDKKYQPSFTGLKEKIGNFAVDSLDVARRKYREELLIAAGQTIEQAPKGIKELAKNGIGQVWKFIRENLIDGVDVTYKNRDDILESLKRNFGDSFADCLKDIDDYNVIASSQRDSAIKDFLTKTFKIARGKKDKFVYTANEYDDLITFHKDPFIKNVCHGIKEFTVGMVLDFCISARNLIRKADVHFGRSDVIATTYKEGGFFNGILDRRIAEKKARDAFYKVSGVFEKASEGVEEAAKSRLTQSDNALREATRRAINENVANLARGSINAASKKVGKYNTKAERAWNRLGTGFVSAMFARNEYYNISMYQNNDPARAKEAGNERFGMDMERQFMTASLTYVVLGAFQGKVNSSIMYAALSLGGITMFSEIAMRLRRHKSLTPLTPEQARLKAEQEESKEKQNKKDEAEIEKIEAPSLSFDTNPLISSSFKNVLNRQNPNQTVFDTVKDKTETSFGALATNNNSQNNTEDNTKKQKTAGILKKVLTVIGGCIGASLLIGFMRSKNILKSDDIIKSISAAYNDTIEKLTRKRLVMPKDEVDSFLQYLKENNFKKQQEELSKVLEQTRSHGALTGQSPVVKKYLPKKEINPEGLYYDLGYIESKGMKTFMGVVCYPIDLVSRVLEKGNTLIKNLFIGSEKPDKDKIAKVTNETAVEFIHKYAAKHSQALCKNDMYSFRKEMEDAFTRHFSEANSQNKNTSIAMISRIIITIFGGYFLANDARNEVLIESKGQDIERANVTAKEKVGQKIANFFFNSMFMDIFNTTFESVCLASVAGATAVAMATEVTNETAVRASVGTPTKQMTRDEIIEYEQKRLNSPGLAGAWCRWFMKVTGKKPISEKAKK